MTEVRTDIALQVRMFGGFSISWNGQEITASSKTKESQFNYLMERLLHAGKQGVSRDKLEEFLFSEREVENTHHALQSVVYNAKKRLQKAGLPDVNYIISQHKRFYWTKEIPVCEDTAEFERLYLEAQEEKDLDRRLAVYQEACRYYVGDFLPSQTGVIWVEQEARKYRAMFCSCVENAVTILRINQDYFQMEELGLYAARIQPLADWETVTMEALTALGRYEDARKLYEDTVDYYFREQGLRPSKRLMELLERLGDQVTHQYAVLDDIQGNLSGSVEEGIGGYLCSYPVFQGIYRMVERMIERGGQSVYLMLCTVVDSKGNPMREGPALEQLSQRLGDAIVHSVRHTDAVNRYGRGQYLVLLVNTTREDCEVIQRRINRHFIVKRQRTGIQYYVNSVITTPDEHAARKKRRESEES